MSVVREVVSLIEGAHAHPVSRLKALRKYWIANVKDFSQSDKDIAVMATINAREEVDELSEQKA